MATLLTVAGGIEIPFRIFNGWLADKRYTSAYTQMTINMLLVGIGAIVCGAVSGVAGKYIISRCRMVSQAVPNVAKHGDSKVILKITYQRKLLFRVRMYFQFPGHLGQI
mgnify:CR=1 FL=1